MIFENIENGSNFIIGLTTKFIPEQKKEISTIYTINHYVGEQLLNLEYKNDEWYITYLFYLLQLTLQKK